MPDLRQKKQHLLAQHLLAVVTIVLLGIAIYGNALHGPFVFDDVPNIQENRFIRVTQLDPVQLYDAAFKSRTNRPLSYLSFALNYYFGKYEVTGYHLVNIGIHLINGILVYFLALAIFQQQARLPDQTAPRWDDRWIGVMSLVAALIFIAHPLQTQSVTYMVQRMTSLATMFYLLALLLYIDGRRSGLPQRRWPLWAGCFLCWMLALGSKQIAATLPVIILLVEWYFFQDLSKDWLKRNRRIFLGLAVLLAVIALLSLGQDTWSKFTDYSKRDFTMGERVMTQFRVLIFYLSLLAVPLPSRLNLSHDFATSHSVLEPISTLVCLLMIGGLLVAAVCLARRQRLVSFCMLWFFVNLVIESSIIPLEMVFEHRLYLPMFGVALLASQLLFWWLASRRTWAAALAGVLILALATGSHLRNRVWQDAVTLWSDVVSKSPQHPRGQYNLGLFLSKQGQYQQAENHLREALRLDPDNSQVHNNLGAVLVDQGQYQQAEIHLREALRLDPEYFEAHGNLGNVLEKQGEYQEAATHLRKALHLDPGNSKAYKDLGVFLARRGQLTEAAHYLREAQRLDPEDAQVHKDLGILLATRGQLTEAENQLREAVRLEPEYGEALNDLGIVLAKQAKYQEAEKHLREALRLNPEDANARNNLDTVLEKLGQ